MFSIQALSTRPAVPGTNNVFGILKHQAEMYFFNWLREIVQLGLVIILMKVFLHGFGSFSQQIPKLVLL